MMRTYFMSNDSMRKDISPVLMKMLGFTDEQIMRENNKKKSGFRLF